METQLWCPFIFMSYSGYTGIVGILISDNHTKSDILKCMDSCQGYPIWVHANTNNQNWADRMQIACKEKGCHYFSRSLSNGMPGRGKNMLMHNFCIDTNLKPFQYCFNIDGDDEWGETFPQLFKRNYDGEFLFLSGGKMQWNDTDKIYDKYEPNQLGQIIRDDVGEKNSFPVILQEFEKMRNILESFYQSPNGQEGVLNRLIGFSKQGHISLQFKEDIKMGEDMVFHIESLMANKQGKLKTQYLYDNDLYLYKPNERGIFYYQMSLFLGKKVKPIENWLSKYMNYLPKSYPKSLKKYKVDWIK